MSCKITKWLVTYRNGETEEVLNLSGGCALLLALNKQNEEDIVNIIRINE